MGIEEIRRGSGTGGDGRPGDAGLRHGIVDIGADPVECRCGEEFSGLGYERIAAITKHVLAHNTVEAATDALDRAIGDLDDIAPGQFGGFVTAFTEHDDGTGVGIR